MKQNIVLTALLLLTTSIMYAQENNSLFKKFYAEVGSGPCSYNGASVSVGAKGVFRSNWMVSVSYSNFTLDPENLPSDYERGYIILIVLPIPEPMPSVTVNMVNVTGGRFFQLGRKTWVTTEAGLSIVSGEKMSFAPQAVSNSILHLSSNYTALERPSESAIGGIIKADFNWAFTPYVGLGVGAFAAMNSIQSPVGAEIKLIVGWLNTKKRKG